jgi:hypothetical protein
MISKYHPAYLTDGLWGKRPGIMFLSRTDGFVVAYDICYKLNETVFSGKVTDYPITSIAINKEGDKLFVADEEGKVSMLKLSKSFYEQTQLQKTTSQAFLNTMFEREVNKEKSIEILIERKKKKGVPKDDAAKQAKQEQQLKERLKQIEMDYMSFVNTRIKTESDLKRGEETNKVLEEKKGSYKDKESARDNLNQSGQSSNLSGVNINNNALNQSGVKENLNQSNNNELNQSKELNNSSNLNISKKDLNNSNVIEDNKSVKSIKEDLREGVKSIKSVKEEQKEDVKSVRSIKDEQKDDSKSVKSIKDDIKEEAEEDSKADKLSEKGNDSKNKSEIGDEVQDQ